MSDEAINLEQVQGNILLPYTHANCARMMFFRFEPGRLAEAREWVRGVASRVTYHPDVRDPDLKPRDEGQGPWINLGFTHEGLRALDYDPFTLKYLPEEFQAGMRERADRLGDVLEDDGYQPPVHMIVMVYAHDHEVAKHAMEIGTAAHQWREFSADAIKDLEYAVYRAMARPECVLPASPAVTHLVELDQDTYALDAPGVPGVEYFGFQDGISQPRIEGATEAPQKADAPPGALLLGFAPPSIRGDVVSESEDTRAQVAARHLKHGSMLVVRKLRQDVEGFRQQTRARAERLAGLDGRQLAELMMGRRMNGDIMAMPAPAEGADFDYSGDPEGRGCPFQSHIRRANPRNDESPIRRIMRRSLPYSRLRQKEADKGVMFLVYNANIEAQFEFVQRLWINSGVENYGLSRDRDPIAGEPARPASGELGKGSFSFTSPVDEQPYTLTGLQSHVAFDWGDYFLVPARKTLEELSADPTSPLAELEKRMDEETLPRLRHDVLARWLDDPDVGPRIWKEVREKHGGVVRFARDNVVLAGSEAAVAEVLEDDGSRYSVCDQGECMRQTTGAFYLGMDSTSPEYMRDRLAARRIIPGWCEDLPADGGHGEAGDGPATSADPRADARATPEQELADVERATQELCVAFFGLSLTDAIANHDRPGRPLRAEFDLAKYTAFVLSGLTPKLFGIPQPSAVGTFAMNIPASGYIFFPFPEEAFLEYADQAARGISSYYSHLFEQRDRRESRSEFPPNIEALAPASVVETEGPRAEETDESWRAKLHQTLDRLEHDSRTTPDSASTEARWTKEDSVRTMAGVVSGMLIASFKLFLDGVSEYTKRFEVGAPITITPGQTARIPFTTMKARETSMPNILYRTAVGRQELAGQVVEDDDFVLTCQGSAMAGNDSEWFYGDRTPGDGERPKAPHFCPGYLAADVMLGAMSSMMLEALPDLRRTDGSGRLLDFDFARGMRVLEGFQQLARAATVVEPAANAAGMAPKEG